ncbi:hypothetical protein E4U55_007957 [Claviceps digitariae]|nr:hypothetical protein E4U55_007957 [Claviceps digitariae]
MDTMNSALNTTFSWANNMGFVDSATRPYYSATVLVLAIGMVTLHALTKKKTNAPFVNPPGFFDFFATRQKLQAVHRAQSLMKDACKAFPGKCFRIMTNFGEVMVLPNKYANELRNDERLDFNGYTNQARLSHLF